MREAASANLSPAESWNTKKVAPTRKSGTCKPLGSSATSNNCYPTFGVADNLPFRLIFGLERGYCTLLTAWTYGMGAVFNFDVRRDYCWRTPYWIIHVWRDGYFVIVMWCNLAIRSLTHFQKISIEFPSPISKLPVLLFCIEPPLSSRSILTCRSCIQTLLVFSHKNLSLVRSTRFWYFLSSITIKNGYHWQNSSLFVHAHSGYECYEDWRGIGIELRRLEQRYMRRKNRSTWSNDVVYVDGEYVHSTKITAATSITSTASSTRQTETSTFSWASKRPAARVKEMKSMIWQWSIAECFSCVH